MKTSSQFIPYANTGFFSKIAIDYISGSDLLKPFYTHPVSLEGIKVSIEERQKYPTNRLLLVEELQKQYAGIRLTEKQQLNIKQLNNSNCYTITTAHQPNIFTGHLYFVYKILHAIKLADRLEKEMPENNFVPVFYMGSEDADLDELGHIYLSGEKKEWRTNQTGAVGRMKVDQALVDLIDAISGQLTIEPFGNELVVLLRSCYRAGVTIEQATFHLINRLFADYGLIVLLPDNAALKNAFIPVIRKELEEGFSHLAVAKTASEFPKAYKVQASGREVNLFYLKDDKRERIEHNGNQWSVVNTDLTFSKEEILLELEHHPERFSPNVILRPVFQEMILPNIVFIGGGGEIAYWLELKSVFEKVAIPFPVILLRNSFLILEEALSQLIFRLEFSVLDVFKKEDELLREIVQKQSNVQLSLQQEKEELIQFYKRLRQITEAIDTSLGRHIENLNAKALSKIAVLEKKMLKAEKKKFEAHQRQLHKLISTLFPNNSLQERVENLLPYYARWGKEFIQILYENSLTSEQEFVILNPILE